MNVFSITANNQVRVLSSEQEAPAGTPEAGLSVSCRVGMDALHFHQSYDGGVTVKAGPGIVLSSIRLVPSDRIFAPFDIVMPVALPVTVE